MVLEEVVWTAIPNQLDEQSRLKISVHLGPRLTNEDGSPTERLMKDARLFVDWPAALARIKFRVEFANNVNYQGVPARVADSLLWRQVFPPRTRLAPFIFQDHSKRDLHSFPARSVHEFIRTTYSNLATSAAEVPSIDDPFGPLARFAPLEHIAARGFRDSQSFYEELAKARNPAAKGKGPGRVVRENIAGAGLPPAEAAAQNAFFEAYRFYSRPGSQNPDLPADYVEPSPAVPDFDFHQRASLLADHPRILRRLGLVVDLVVDLAEPAAVLPPNGTLRVVPEGDTGNLLSRSPWTAYELQGSWFGARPRQPQRVQRGMLNLDPRFWELAQLDVDGAALQAIGFADTLRRLRDVDRRNHATPAEATVPALRSGGLSMALTGRADRLLEDLMGNNRKNEELTTDSPPTLYAEDLIRGYRIDVHDADAPGGAKWFSLHRRVAEHRSRPSRDGEEAITFQVVDEGYIKATNASAEREDHPSPSSDLYLHETVFGWDGWSLSAPRPGKSIVEPGQGENKTSIDRFDPASGTGPLITQLSVEPRTLPRMRVGHRYRFRARTVDLAGNSRAFSDSDIERGIPVLASQERMFMRFEPVPSPTVLRRNRDTEGESLETLIIRSDLGMSAEEYGSPQTQRHLAAPKGSQQMAEHHGRFDSAFGSTPAAATAALRMALREEGTFLDEKIVDPATGQKTVAQTTLQLVPASTPPPARRGDGLPDGAYAIYPDDTVVLPYLPDPLAIGVSLTGYDYAGKVLFEQVALFEGAWPDVQPIRLRLSEGPIGTAFANGVLDVRLPQSEVVYARLSTVFPEDQLENLAIWNWAPAAAKAVPAFRQDALNGRHWMLTPFRWLTLMHAVQRPLAVPDMTKVRSLRALGSTFVEFSGPLANHAKSTSRLDIEADWTEDVDILTDDAPRMRARGTAVSHHAHACGFDIEPTEDSAETNRPDRQLRHELGDTKHRRIVYHSVATTRFRETLPRSIAENRADLERVETTALSHNILSTARPAAPEVAYVVPTFKWEKQDGPTSTHLRRGKAVRVWLRRPWFSSGDGEQLAVVLRPHTRLPFEYTHINEIAVRAASQASSFRARQSRAAPPALGNTKFLASVSSALPSAAGATFSSVGNALPAELFYTAAQVRTMLTPYVTDWGLDPAWESALPLNGPTVGDFPRRAGQAADLTLDELPDVATVVIAAHDVTWDANRKLWFCDIEIDAGDSYFPFVRLALARYQANSVGGAHLSRITMTDFIQLAPDRRAELSVVQGRASLTVQGFAGNNYAGKEKQRLQNLSLQTAPESLQAPATVVRMALQRQAAGVDDELGWELVNETTLTPSAAGFFITWRGSLPVPAPETAGRHRILVTESELHIRTDMMEGDPTALRSPAELLRERIVYADVFDLGGSLEREGGEGEPAEEDGPELPPYRGPDPPGMDWKILPALAPDPNLAVNAVTKLAQSLLNAWAGEAATPLKIDGRFGPLTGNAVERFRQRMFLPAGRALDPATWIALGLAAPYPRLEAGIGAPPMAGPPIFLAQRLLNLAAGEIVAPLTGEYDADTRTAVRQFQQGNGLEAVGAVDLPTWLALNEYFDRGEAVGAESVTLTLDRDVHEAGGKPFSLDQRVALPSPGTPVSHPTNEDWLGRAGYWVELQDDSGLPLFRRILGSAPGEPPEVVGEPGSGNLVVRSPVWRRRTEIRFVVPIIPVSRRLCIFGNLEDPAAPAQLLQTFEPWLE